MIDFPWLLANLEVGSVQQGVDETSLEPVETFVLGRKAVSAAETYVLGLFQLYETVYLHKTTRGIEKLFAELLWKVISHAKAGDLPQTGLPKTHPLVRFAERPDDLDTYLALDDSTIWGSLPLLEHAEDRIVVEFAKRLKNRELYQCCDVRTKLVEVLGASAGAESRVRERCAKVAERLQFWREENPTIRHRLLVDRAEDRYPGAARAHLCTIARNRADRGANRGFRKDGTRNVGFIAI